MTTTTKQPASAPAPSVAIGIEDTPQTVASLLKAKKVTFADVLEHVVAERATWDVGQCAVELLPIVGGANFAKLVEALTTNVVAVQVSAATSKAKKPSEGTYLDLGPLGTVCVYRLNRRPLVAYATQWRKLAVEQLGMTDETFDASPIGQFIAGNPSKRFPLDRYDTKVLSAIRDGKLPWARVEAGQVVVTPSMEKTKLD